MVQSSTDISPVEATQMLDWLIAMDADEIVSEVASNRFEMVSPVEMRQPVRADRTVPSTVAPAVASGRHVPLSVATEDHVVSSSISQLAAAFAAFEGCGLRKSAMNFCFLGGNPQARILVLSDRPRTSEDKEGLVVAGKNAALLEAMLKAIGLSMANDVMLANFVPWRPPGNRPVTDLEAKPCVPFAQNLISLVRPHALLMLGGLPGQWLASMDQSIAKQRGKWAEVDGVPVISTFHPDDLLRTQTLKKLAWNDLKLFRAKLEEVGAA